MRESFLRQRAASRENCLSSAEIRSINIFVHLLGASFFTVYFFVAVFVLPEIDSNVKKDFEKSYYCGMSEYLIAHGIFSVGAADYCLSSAAAGFSECADGSQMVEIETMENMV